MRERVSLLALAACALGTRLAFVSAFPTRPFADFRNLVRFAQAYAEDGFARGFAGWEMWSLGLPLALSFVLRVAPGSPEAVARSATAAVTGLAALAPFFIWRGALSLRARVLASLLLAAWPGHVLVSGVVSQDNWVLLPSVALAALAVRELRQPGRGHPLAAALSWVAAGAIRQEMFVVLLPAALAAAGPWRPWRRWSVQGLATFTLTAGLLMLAMAGLRWVGSGRFALGTEHRGLALLGACAPGAGSSYWTFAQTYFAAVEPDSAEDWERMKRRAGALAVREILRRPRFHAVRMVAAGTNSLLRTDEDGLFTSIGSEEALPAAYVARGIPLAWALKPWLRAGTVVLAGLTVGALVLALRRGDTAVLLLGATLALKVGIHAVTAAQYRYFEVVTALALLVLALTADALAARWPGSRTVLTAALMGAMAAALLVAVAHASEDWVERNEEQLTYRFTLKDPRRDARLRCVVRRGLLTLLYAPRRAAIRPLQAEPRPGEQAAAECVVEARRTSDALVFAFRDAFPDGGFPGRMVQVVTLDGQEVLRHDLGAEPGSEWHRVRLGPMADGQTRRVTLSVIAQDPRPPGRWGLAANTAFQLEDEGEE